MQSESFPSDAHARAVVESQLLSIRARLIDTLHTTKGSIANDTSDSTFASSAGLKRCIVTGGGSHNHVLQQLAADVLGLPVFTAASGGGSAASGGALLAKFAWWKREQARKNAIPPTAAVLSNVSNGVEREASSVAVPKVDTTDSTGGATFEEMRKAFGDVLILDRVAEPKIENEHFYGRLLDEFRRCEQVIVDDLKN